MPVGVEDIYYHPVPIGRASRREAIYDGPREQIQMGIISRGVPLPQDIPPFVRIKEVGVSVYRRYKIWGRGNGGERQPNNG